MQPPIITHAFSIHHFSIFSPLCAAEMYENQIHRHESSRTSSSAMKKQLSNSTMHGSTEIIAKESSHQTYTR